MQIVRCKVRSEIRAMAEDWQEETAFARLEVDDLKSMVAERGNKQPLALHVN